MEEGKNYYLLKNAPLGNYIDEAIEFCIIITDNHEVVDDCYIECKYYSVNGSAYQKIQHVFTEHYNTHEDNNSCIIVIYDGKDFRKGTKSMLHVENIKENYIKHNKRQLILSAGEFKNTFLKKLCTNCGSILEVFKQMKEEGY